MQYFFYIFGILSLILIILEFWNKNISFQKLSTFLEQNLFFNQTKIIMAVLYIVSVNIRWYSHSLYINNTNCPAPNWAIFYKVGISENIESLKFQKNLSIYLGTDFKDIVKKEFNIELYIYKYKETQTYKFKLTNILNFLINSKINLLDNYSYFTDISSCKEIPKELGLNEIDLKNLIELSYIFYYLDIDGYIGEEKRKKIDKNFSSFPFPVMFSLIISIGILFFYIYNILFFNKVESIFLYKIINFDSLNFDIYIKKLDEIKKNSINNNNKSQEEEKDDFDFINSYSNNDNKNLKNDISEKSNKNKIEKKKNKQSIFQFKKKK